MKLLLEYLIREFLILECQKRFPLFASTLEDKTFRDKKWQSKYDGE